MNKRDIGSHIKAVSAIHATGYDGASDINGTTLDRIPSAEQTYISCVFVFRLLDAAADEDVDIVVEESTDGGSTWSTLKDVGKVTYDQSAGETVKEVDIDLLTAGRHIRARVKSESGSDTDVGNADLTVTGVCVFGGARKIPV